MANNGWIKIYRQLMDHDIYTDKPFDGCHAWIDLLLLANHEDICGVMNGEPYTFRRGSVNRSISWFSKRWGWSKTKVSRFFTYLGSDGMIVRRPGKRWTEIQIVNYAEFQNVERKSPEKRYEVDTEVETPETRMNTGKSAIPRYEVDTDKVPKSGTKSMHKQEYKEDKKRRSTSPRQNRFSELEEWAKEGDNDEE